MKSSDNTLRWLVIVNSVAGGKSLELFPSISKQLREEGILHSPIFTEHKFHAVELTVSAINAGWRRLMVVGGDGTIHEVVEGLFIQKAIDPRQVELSVIPTGKSNGWARGMNIPLNISAAISNIKLGNRALKDVGTISYEESQFRQTRHMANVAGAGFDAYAMKRHTHLYNKGCRRKWRFLLKGVRSFFKYKPTGVKVWVDDVLVYNDLLISVAVGNGRYNIGGVQQLPEAETDDGLLDITLIRPVHFWHILFRIRYLFNGEIYRIGHILQSRGEKIRIESTPEITVEVDGEIMGESYFEFGVLPKAICVVVPQE